MPADDCGADGGVCGGDGDIYADVGGDDGDVYADGKVMVLFML
jgi:hypothetical protein